MHDWLMAAAVSLGASAAILAFAYATLVLMGRYLERRRPVDRLAAERENYRRKMWLQDSDDDANEIGLPDCTGDTHQPYCRKYVTPAAQPPTKEREP